MMKDNEPYSEQDAKLRLDSAIRGARIVGAATAAKVMPKDKKGKPSNTSPSTSNASRANAKTERP
jgi:hypothetical protein